MSKNAGEPPPPSLPLDFFYMLFKHTDTDTLLRSWRLVSVAHAELADCELRRRTIDIRAKDFRTGVHLSPYLDLVQPYCNKLRIDFDDCAYLKPWFTRMIVEFLNAKPDRIAPTDLRLIGAPMVIGVIRRFAST